MIRVAVIMGKMHSGGKKNLVMEYYRHVDRSKIQFDFICDEDSNGIPKREISELGGRIYVIAPYQHLLKNMCQIYKICKANKYPIMHGYNNTLNVFSMFVGKLAGIPVRINESISMGSSSGDWKNYFKNILKPFNHLFATDYMANGETCGRWQFGNKLFDEGKVTVFKTVIDAEKHRYDPELRNKTRDELGISNNLVIGHIGRLTEQKNTLFLIDIFYEILQKRPEAILLLVGDGNLREKVLQKIKDYNIEDKVIYLGTTEDIHKLYNAMDCFLLPSIYEGLPVVGVEAECTGLPMFFSTAVPKESSPCEDLGFFVGLDKSASEWAEKVITETDKLQHNRRNRVDDIKKAGFDSAKEAHRLMEYYEAKKHA